MYNQKIKLLTLIILSVVVLSGCNLFKSKLKAFEQAIKGMDVVVQTYDEDSYVIDRIEGKSVSIASDKKFELKDADGSVIDKSSVISMTVSGKEVLHVGSSLILREAGLEDLIETQIENVNLYNDDPSVPFINRFVNDFKNVTSGKSKLILVRSQTGKPLATFIGDNVSHFATDIDKSTGLLIDGKYLFIYRSDYTIYDLALFDE